MTDAITYRTDEIAVIFNNCKTIPELDKATHLIGYLVRTQAQTYKPVITRLATNRSKELIKNLKK